MPSGQLTYELLDSSVGRDSQNYTLAQIYKVGSYTVRVRIRRNFYEHQSHAVAEVLRPSLEWESILNDPASNWHYMTPHSVPQEHLQSVCDRLLVPIAERLIRRSATVLSAL